MSVSSQASCSTSSTYPIPITPEHVYTDLPDFSPHVLSPKTPESFIQYASALKARMAAGLSNAMKELKDDRGGPERAFDVNYGYDEDPIERHVRLYLTPRRPSGNEDNLLGLSGGMSRRNSGSASGSRLDVEYDTPEDDHATEAQPFRPGLINFHRSFPSTAPSLSTMESSSSNGEYTRYPETDTPGSILSYTSESSFGSSAPEYNRSSHVADVFIGTSIGSPLSLGDEEGISKRSSAISISESIMTVVPDKLSSPKSKVRIRSSLSSRPIILSEANSTKSHIQPKSDRRSLFSRPSLLRPRIRPRPKTTLDTYMSDMDIDNQVEEKIGVAFGGEDEEENWLDGRTVSETMIAVAGLQCQRGRGIMNSGRD